MFEESNKDREKLLNTVMVQINKAFKDAKDVEKNLETKEVPEVNEGAPPPYDTLYGKLQQAKSTSDGNVNFAKNAVTVVRGSCKPPTYEEMLEKMKKATKSSDGNVSFVKTFCAIVCGLFAVTIVLGLMLGIPVASIVMGSIYLHDCPAERFIPIHLIVMGVFSIVKDFCCSCNDKKDKEQENKGEKKGGDGFRGIIGLFLFVWFICGNVWIYRTYNHFSTDPTQPDYCHPTLFNFSFWLLNGTYIFIGLACFLFCCFGIAVACFVRGDNEIDCKAVVCESTKQNI